MEITPNEREGVAGVRSLIQEFLDGVEGTQQVRDYLSAVVEDESFMLIYLRGRKYRVNYAWETLKRNAEVRFNEYPEVFPETPPKFGYRLQAEGGGGILKARDKFGRRIICFNAAEWNPDEVSMDQVTAALTFLMDNLILDKDAINNGIILVQNCDGVGWKHVKQYTLHAMKRLLNIFWYAYPIKFNGIYFVNCPSYAGYAYKMIKPFLKKKIQERVLILTNDKSFEYLHEKLPTKILPKFLGGDIENCKALQILELPPIK